MQLTTVEITTLIEALKAWEREPVTKGFGDAMFSTMLEGLLPEKEGQTKEERMREREQKINSKQNQANRDAEMRREDSLLLQAKLIAERREVQRKELAE